MTADPAVSRETPPLSTAGLKPHMGVWLPAGETHLVEWMSAKNVVVDGKGTYQIHKLLAAMKHVRRFRRAVDVGAHCGLWSMHLARRFELLDAFEPVALHRQAFRLNVPERPGVRLWGMALGAQTGSVSMHSAATSSGDTTVAGAGDIPMRRLDDVLSGADDVDFIKLDCEGYELHALRGAEQLLRRCKPVIIVEQKPGKAQAFGLPQTGAVDYLRELGFKLQQEIAGDYIMAHGGCGCGERRQALKQAGRKVAKAVGLS